MAQHLTKAPVCIWMADAAVSDRECLASKSCAFSAIVYCSLLGSPPIYQQLIISINDGRKPTLPVCHCA